MQECSWRQRVIRKRVPAAALTERTGCWLQEETVVQKGVECGPQHSTFLFSYQQDVFQKSQTIIWWKHNDSLKVATRLLKGQQNDCWSNLTDDVNDLDKMVNLELNIKFVICVIVPNHLFWTRQMCYVFTSDWFINNGTWWGHVTACTHIKPQNYDLFKIPQSVEQQ